MNHNFESYEVGRALESSFYWEELICHNCNLILYKENYNNKTFHRFILNNKVIEVIDILYYSDNGCSKCYFNNGQTKFTCDEIIIKNIID